MNWEIYYEAGIVAYVYNLELSGKDRRIKSSVPAEHGGAFNLREADAGGSLWIWSQSGLQNNFS